MGWSYKIGTISDWGVVTERKSEDEQINEIQKTEVIIPPWAEVKLSPLIIYMNANTKLDLSKMAKILNLDFVPAKNEVYKRSGDIKFVQGWLYGQLEAWEYTWVVQELKNNKFWDKRLTKLPRDRKIIKIL